jgi:hypothetical protein
MGSSDDDCVCVVWRSPDVNAVASGQEGVEALDEHDVAGEEMGDARNDARSVDSGVVSRGDDANEVTHVWALKSFIMSRNWLYTSGSRVNWTLTASR